jgi:hypothetical protein
MPTTMTAEITRTHWPDFFNAFSLGHENWLVTVEIFAPEIGAQVAADSLRFEGINADLKAGQDKIIVSLGESADANITHVISAPAHVWIERSELERGTFETLQIEAEGGATTLIRFLAGVEPDTV